MPGNHDEPTEPADLAVGDVIRDSDSGEEHLLVVDIDDAGVTVRRGDAERYVPHAQFGPWNDESLVVHRRNADESSDRERSDASEGHC